MSRRIYPNELCHYGVLGMKWGVRRYQNPDGTLTDVGKRHYAKADYKWAQKNNDRIISKTKKKVSSELRTYAKNLSKQEGYLTSRGQISKTAINAYNQKMAQLMNMAVDEIKAPSGRTVQFVAKRGEVGVYIALTEGYADLSQFNRGVWSDGRLAYKKDKVGKINI